MGCAIKRLLTITTPIKYKEVTLWNENGQDITKNCLYSWSSDSLCWTNFVKYEEYQAIGPKIEGDFYLRVLMFYGFSKIALDNAYIDCYSICLYNENPFRKNLCSNAFNIYANLDCALYMYQQLSDFICCMIGIPCYYFRVTPDQDTADFTFKEYVLHNVTDVKTIKLVLQDGQMPSSKPMMTEFDFDWEVDWEVEVGKTMFAGAFGDTAFPKQRDIIYVPMMKRIYEVNSAYDEKQESFMWRPMTWKLGLVKWNEKTNVDQNEFESVIDNWIDNKYEDFHPLEITEEEKESGTTQTEAPTFTANNLSSVFMADAIRKEVTATEKTKVYTNQLNNRSVVTTRNIYRFTTPDSGITYQKPFCGDSGTLMFIVEVKGNSYGTFPHVLFQAGALKVLLTDYHTLSFNGMSYSLDNGTYQVILKWNRTTFTTEMNIYEYTHEANLPLYRLKPEMYWFDFVDPVVTLTAPYNNDLVMSTPVSMGCSPVSVGLSNIRIYDTPLSEEDTIVEAMKYTTTNEHNILNDVAREIEAPYGFNVR